MGFNFGEALRVQIFGESHGEAVGCVIEGLPAGMPLDLQKVGRFLSRRSPGKSSISSGRAETDKPKIISGLKDGHLTGAPFAAIFENHDVRSGDYEAISDTPRPNHADYAAFVKYGVYSDRRGGGQFSGRLTAPLCFAGACALQFLEHSGVHIGAHIERIGDVADLRFDPLNISVEFLENLALKDFPVIDDVKGGQMKAVIEAAREELDSVGGAVECAAIGLPAGLGEPRYYGIESAVARIIFGIPAIKGLEFGLGFGFAEAYGSDVNDGMTMKDGRPAFLSNNCGGCAGGITDGRPLIFRCAFKPTPSIGKKQNTVNLKTRENTEIEIKGRHDPCVVPRAVPAVEAAAALATADLMLLAKPAFGGK
ncbi:MAG TPA: chorismate synthase [Clostridiales bacterium]|nr:chorismate synthase [Clostridiales bacterium]